MNTLFWVVLFITVLAAMISLVRHEQLVTKKCTLEYNRTLSENLVRMADDLLQRLRLCRTLHERWIVSSQIHEHMHRIEDTVIFIDSIRFRKCFKRQPAKIRNTTKRFLTSMRASILSSRDALVRHVGVMSLPAAATF